MCRSALAVRDERYSPSVKPVETRAKHALWLDPPTHLWTAAQDLETFRNHMRQAPHCLRITYLAALFVLNALAQFDTEESALLDFAHQLDNFQVLCHPPL